MRPDPAAVAPLPDIDPPDETVWAFDALGLDYERAFRDLPALDAALDRLLGALAPGSHVLDVGCGTGRPAAARLAAAGHHVIGIDVSPVMVDIARRQVPAATFAVADVRTFPSQAASWDAIVAFFPLLTMPRPELDAVLARLAAMLVPGGRLTFATVPADVDGIEIEFLGQPIRAFTYPADVLLAKLSGAGLEIVQQQQSAFRPDHPEAIDEAHLFVDARAPH